MANDSPAQIRSLIDRLARLDAAEAWSGDLNPAQVAALSYLSRANRFSRSPSQVADYLGATRGTTSQTLKVLERKGYLVEQRSLSDRRSISYSVSHEGQALAGEEAPIEAVLRCLDGAQAAALEHTLREILQALLDKRGGRAFGVCRTCRYHQKRGAGGFCTLLSEPLKEVETTQICFEHKAPKPAHN
ncbi:MarR family winged helix-turn-helix transcriptional regulator [Limibacillus sp. MBR-115]|jgi:DNA-binding MarR family transcriptional regulator|uniref:MarR family winged helix-turn-helix transcriptional regulator n=1 Tax=Limibacillus sp. MBR-115 TaxID=3156465 RepID=UPI003398C70A